MQSFDFRIKVIREYLDQEVLNDDLRKEMNIEFIKKGLSTRVVDAVFGDETPLDSLDEIYHMAILRVINLYTKDNKYDLNEYFSKAAVANYITFKSIETEEKSDTILLKNFIYNEDDNSYVGYLSYLDLYKYIKDVLITYNFLSQRESKIKKLSTGGTVKAISLNKRSVKEIADLISKDGFYNTTIILNVPIIRGKKSQFNFNVKFENVGNIIVEPNLDINSDTFTRCDIVDGYHRSLGIMRYIESFKEEYGSVEIIQKKIPVQVTRLTVESAAEMVAQTFKRNDIKDTQFIKAREKNDYTKFAEDLINNTYLKNNVSLTYDEMISERTISYKLLISESIKKNNIDVSDSSNNIFLVEDMSKIINTLRGLMDKSSNVVLNGHDSACNMPIVLITISYLLKDKLSTASDYKAIMERLENIITEDVYKQYGLNIKNVNISKLIDFIKNNFNDMEGR